jgi:hypothetical protein
VSVVTVRIRRAESGQRQGRQNDKMPPFEATPWTAAFQNVRCADSISRRNAHPLLFWNLLSAFSRLFESQSTRVPRRFTDCLGLHHWSRNCGRSKTSRSSLPAATVRNSKHLGLLTLLRRPTRSFIRIDCRREAPIGSLFDLTAPVLIKETV